MLTEATEQLSTIPLLQTVKPIPGACVICHGTIGSTVYQEAGHTGQLCQCGLVFIDPLPIASSIDPKFDLHLETYYSLPAKLRIDWVEKHASGTRLLDVGAGNGATVAEALSRGFDVSAIEPNSDCATKLAASFNIPIQQTIVEEADLPVSGFDVVFHVDLLSHFRDPVAVLKKMSAMLNPDSGVLCFEVGLFGGMHKRWYRFSGRPGFPQHLWFFSLKNVEELLQQANLELVDSRQFNIAPSTILSSTLLKWAPSKLQSKPGTLSLKAAEPGKIWHLYHYVHYLLRYRLGAILPAFGPSTAFIVAAPKKIDR